MHCIQSLGVQLGLRADCPGLLLCGAASRGIRVLQRLCKGVDDFGFKGFFSVSITVIRKTTASKMIDLFGHSQKYTGKLQLHHILQITISCSGLA